MIFNLILIFSVSSFCFAQENNFAKEVELLKLKTGDLIDHIETKDYTNIRDKNGQIKIIYSYIGQEVDNTSNIIFKNDENYSNTIKLDDKHYRIYTSPQFYKDENNIIYKIEVAETTKEVWQEANVKTIFSRIKDILKTPYALAGTSYGFNDLYLTYFNNTNWYEVRSANSALNQVDSIVAFNFVDDSISPNAYYNFRTTIDFNLSLIDPSTIESGALFLYTDQDESETNLYSYAFYKGTQAIPATLDDYNNYTDDQFTEIIAEADIDNESYNSWSFNNDGIDYLKNGNSSFMFREVLYDVGSSTPPSLSTIIEGRSFINSTGDFDKRPYIELTLSATGTTTPVIMSAGSDIGIIYYNATSTKIDDNTTITSATYNIPFLLFKYVSIIMAFCFAVLITFFLSFINKKKKL